jgi:hypothetical protein
MKPTRSDLARRLDALGQRSTPGPDPEFVNRLEERLAEGAWQPTVANAPLGRSRRRNLVAVGVAASVLAISGSVAALTMMPDGRRIVVHTLTDGVPTTPAAPSTTTTAIATTTTVAEPAVTATTAAPPPPDLTIAPPTATVPITARPTTTVERPATTVPSTEPPTTEAPATTTATTEVHAPMTLNLACTPVFDAGLWSVRCEWSASTAGEFTRYRVLRSVEGQPGRAFVVGHDVTTYVDTTVERGVAYRYLVRAERADETAVETSPLVTVTWPAEPPASTTTSTTPA